MAMFNKLRLRLRALFFKSKLEEELDEEVRFHLEREIEENIARGMSPEEARLAALRSFGGVERVKEESRDERGIRLLDEVWQDLRYGGRMLVKHPGFAFIAVLTLALGIGANTAIFSVVNAVLLRPLPFNEPERLVMVWLKGPEAAGGDRVPLPVADLLDWRAQNGSFESVGAFRTTADNYTGGESPERVRAASVTANFFTTLGAHPALGRTFQSDEERPGAQSVVVISQQFWRKHFAADPQVIGRSINLSGASFTIIGVMPEAFDYPARDVELWTAMQLQAPNRRGPFLLIGVARLKPGVTLPQARAEMNSMKSSFAGEKFDFNVLPINEFIVGEAKPAILMLLTAVTLVLLIAAANVANLLLARAASREKEIVIRAALGASRWRVVRQLLTESLLLALIGGGLGLLMAWRGVDLLLKLAPEDLPRLQQIGIDGRVFGWTALVSLLTGLVFGLAPALQSARLNLDETLKEGGRGETEGAGKRRWRNLLVVSELAMAVMLLIGAGLLLNSFWRLQRVDPGVDPRQTLTMQIPLQGPRYAQSQQANAFYDQLIERVKTLPGVRAAAVSNSLPPDEQPWSDDFTIEGRPVDPREAPIANDIRVSPEYFQTLGARLLRGRTFSSTDSGNAPQVMVINDTLARRYFPRENPIGKRINRGTESQPSVWEIIGVVGDIKYKGLGEETLPAFYQPIAQNTWRGVFLIVKTDAADPLGLAGAVSNEIRSLDRELPVTQIRTLEQRLYASVAQPRFRTAIVALFAALALILASIGIYGVISYSVTQRTHEMGIRIALGARSRDVLSLVVKQGMALTVIGLSVGLSASFALTRLMKTLLFGVSATDPLTFIVISLLLTVVALLACWIPARRATKVDPLLALRRQ
jgi:putative ABC transport system permease protein